MNASNEDRSTPSPTPQVASRWLPAPLHLVLGLFIAGLGIFGHRENLGYGMMGFDAYMQVIAARIVTAQDFWDTFTEVLTDGRIDAQFYRPVQNLLMAMDYHFWGIDPWGYHLTSLIVFGLTILTIYGATARMLGPGAWFGPSVAALFFALHPVMLNVLPSPARRSDMLVILFLMLILYILPVTNRRKSWGRLIAAGLLTIIASGAKDIGVMAMGMVFWHQFFFRFEGGTIKSIWRAWVATMPTAIGAGLYLINRTVVLQGFGGYQVREGVPEVAYLAKLKEFGSLAVTDVLCPFVLLPQSWLPDRWGALEVALSSLVLVISAAILFAMAMGLSRMSERKRGGVVLFLGLSWMIPPTILLGAMNWYGPWYGAIPTAGIALLLGGLAHIAASYGTGRWFERPVALLPMVVVAVVFIMPNWFTPAWVHYTEWTRGTRLLTDLLQDLDAQMAEAEMGTSIYVKPTPFYEDPPGHRPENRPQLRWVATTMVKGIQAYSELKYPEKNPKAVYSHTAMARTPPPANQVLVRVRYSEVPTR